MYGVRCVCVCEWAKCLHKHYTLLYFTASSSLACAAKAKKKRKSKIFTKYKNFQRVIIIVRAYFAVHRIFYIYVCATKCALLLGIHHKAWVSLIFHICYTHIQRIRYDLYIKYTSFSLSLVCGMWAEWDRRREKKTQPQCRKIETNKWTSKLNKIDKS